MENLNASTFSCRHCQYYHHEGRRGGNCQRLGVPVQGDWEPCPLMIPSFAATWNPLESVISDPTPEMVCYARETVQAY